MKEQKKVEFIESYIKGVNGSADYQWHDNHGELIRCKDCKHRGNKICPFYQKYQGEKYDDWFCADGERKE